MVSSSQNIARSIIKTDDMINYTIDDLSLVTHYFKASTNEPAFCASSDFSDIDGLCRSIEGELHDLQKRRAAELSSLCRAYENRLQLQEKELKKTNLDLKLEVSKLSTSVNHYRARYKKYRDKIKGTTAQGRQSLLETTSDNADREACGDGIIHTNQTSPKAQSVISAKTIEDG